MSSLTLFAVALTASTVLAQAPQYSDERQVFWQRTLDDALELSHASGRPLLIAINADGESASELIVRERYRDPAWVAHTRSFVCVIASYFRHTPRDYADDESRIHCPRFGEVTCSEHMELEPATHRRYLEGVTIELFGEVTDRISPRHVLVSPAGEVIFDRYLLFDLVELDRELEQFSARFPAGAPTPTRAWSGRGPFDPSARARLATEDALHAGGWNALSALLATNSPPRGAVEWLRRLGPALPREELAPLAFAFGARHGELERARAWLRAAVAEGGESRARALPAFAQLGASHAPDRSLYRSFVGLAGAPEVLAAREMLARVEGDQVAAELARSGVGVGLFSLERFAARSASASVEPTRAVRERPELPSEAQLEAELELLEPLLAAEPQVAAHRLRAGRTLLGLARRRIEARASGAELLLGDAREHLALASAADPTDVSLFHDRARIANLLSRFDEQERMALEALRAVSRGEDGGFESSNAESLRWLGDACARRLAERSGRGAVDEIVALARGGASFAIAASAADSDATDWVSLSSYFGALGRAREREEFAYQGLRRFPASQELWSALADACAARGRPERYVELAEQLADSLAQWPEPRWYAGQACVWLAQWGRRGEDSLGAIAAYRRAEQHFERALELAPAFSDSCEHYLALCALGRGFAHLQANRRVDAAACVVDAARIRPEVVTARDGLDREGVDLIDGVLEARASGRTPVDPRAWLAELAAVDPRNPYWARSIADAQLREAIRAYERNRLDLGDWHFEQGRDAARLARTAQSGPESDQALAQVLTVFAERVAEFGGDETAAREALREAAEVLGLAAPALEDRSEWDGLRAALRDRLGAARPVFRAGR